MKIITVFILLFSVISVSAQTNFSLTDAQQYALKHKTEALNANLDFQIAKKEISALRATGLPQINAEGTFQRFLSLPVSLIPAEFMGGQPGEFIELQFGTDYNVTGSIAASQLIFDGSYFVGLQAASAYKELTQQQQLLTERDLKLNVARAYYSVLLTKENNLILAKNITEVQKQLHEAEQIYKNGFIEELDVDRLRLTLSTLTNQKQQIERQYEISLLLLKYQMGYPVKEQILLTDSLNSFVPESDPQDLPVVNVTNRQEYKVMERSEKMYRLNVKNNKMRYLPTISAFASYQQSAQRNEFTFFESDKSWFTTAVAGASIKLPIWDSFHKAAQVQKAQLELHKVLNQKTDLTQALTMQNEKARTEYQSAWEKYINQRENLDLAEKIQNKTTIKYNEGVGSSLEVSTAQNAYYQVQSQYLSALFELLVAQLEWEKTLE
jgi:outer membrane protein